MLLGAGAAATIRQPATTAHAAARPHAVHPVPAVPAAAPAAPAVPVPGPLGASWLALNPPPDLDVHAESGVLVDLDRRQVMWARDERSPRPPASLTKLLTVMVAADLAGSLDRQVTVPAEATQLESDSTLMGLSPGEVVSVRELMAGVFLVSGNDAAETLARALTDRDHFVELMNAKATALGMRDSHFTNPSGLDDPGLRASAFDLAVAGETIVTRYPDLLAIAGAKDQVIAETATHRAFALHSLIKLVATYPGAGGLKTGYTDDAGYCLVGVATRGAHHLMVVLLRSDLALTVDATHLLDYGFAHADAEPPDPSAFANL